MSGLVACGYGQSVVEIDEQLLEGEGSYTYTCA